MAVPWMLAGCTLAEVVVPESEDVLVVEAVLRTDRDQQTIMLHRSVRGGGSVAEPRATVAVRGPGGEVIPFLRAAECAIRNQATYAASDPGVEVNATCYHSLPSRGFWVVPGAVYDLDVQLPGDVYVGGRTAVPGGFALVGTPFEVRMDEPEPCWLPAGGSFELRWTRASGAWGYLAPMLVSGLAAAAPPGVNVPDPLELVGVAVSAADTSIAFPAEFGVFDRFSTDQELLRILQRGLPDGARARVTVAAADRNYINGVRGGTFNPSGQVRVSSVTGPAVGVFGSVVSLNGLVEAGGDPAGRPPCGAG
jgi:hypothetical protein